MARHKLSLLGYDDIRPTITIVGPGSTSEQLVAFVPGDVQKGDQILYFSVDGRYLVDGVAEKVTKSGDRNVVTFKRLVHTLKQRVAPDPSLLDAIAAEFFDNSTNGKPTK